MGHLLRLAPRAAWGHGAWMQFLSDNAAPVHHRVWDAMRAADGADLPYDGDGLSQRLDAAFADTFGRDCGVIWATTGTAANCLALSTMAAPHGGVICHREAHIETSEGGAPGFYLHGAKLMLAQGEGAKLTPAAISDVLAGIKGGVHQVQAHAISISQATEYGLCYAPGELAALGQLAASHGLGLHMDGARFANAAAYLQCSPGEAAGPVDALCFGFTKNGAMNAEAIVLFDPAQADLVRWRRKRAGQLHSKGRFVAAQILALLKDDLWLDLARAANDAIAEVASAAGERCLHAPQSNELFVHLDPAQRAALRAQGFAFYDWNEDLIRLVASWNTPPAHAEALGRAIAAL